MVRGHRDRGRPAERPHRAAQGRTTSAASSSSPTTVAQGPRARREPARAWSSRGTRSQRQVIVDRARSSGSTGPRPRRTSRTRPRGSQLGAWASPQSQVVADRAALDAALAERERAVRRRRAGAGAAALGRLGWCRRRSSSGRAGRPAARPAALPRTGERADRRAAGTVTSGSRTLGDRDGLRRHRRSTPGRCGIRPTAGCSSATSCRSSASSSPRWPSRCRCTRSPSSSLWVGLLGLAGAGAAGGLRRSGAARSPTRSTGAGCCWPRAAHVAGHARAAGPGAAGRGQPGAAAGLVAVQSVAFAVSSPTRSAILPRLVPGTWPLPTR